MILYCKNIIKKAICRFNAILIKLPMVFSQNKNKKNLNVCMEIQKTLHRNINLEIEKQSWRNQAPWLQTIL